MKIWLNILYLTYSLNLTHTLTLQTMKDASVCHQDSKFSFKSRQCDHNQNGHHFTDIFKCILFNEKFGISIKIPLNPHIQPWMFFIQK